MSSTRRPPPEAAAVRSAPQASRAPSPGARWPARALAGAGVAATLLAAGLACGDRGRDGGGTGAARDGARRGRVVLFGVDGADWQVIEPLVARGRLPSFQRLIEDGATGILMSMEPSASPSLWTTIATGVGPDRHGIHGFVVPREPGGARAAGGRPAPMAEERAAGGPEMIRPVTSDMRRAPAFWNILSRQGVSVGVVGWLVTWPAEPVNGFIVSSYLPYVYNWSTGRPLKGTIVEGIPRQTHPEGLIDELEPDKVRPADLDDAAVRRFYDPARVSGLLAPDRECVEGFRWSLACDETYRRIGLRLFDSRPVDLFAVYFGGVDVASHRFWKFAWPEALRYGVRAQDAAVLGRVIEEYYAWVDERLGEYLERLGPDDTILVLSDHGFRPVLLPGKPATSGHHRPEGIFGILGRGARRGHRIQEASILDVLPTVLVLLDRPVAMDLEGRVIEEALDPVFAAAHRPRFVDHFDEPPAPAGATSEDVDANVLERLRSLGYIQ